MSLYAKFALWFTCTLFVTLAVTPSPAQVNDKTITDPNVYVIAMAVTRGNEAPVYVAWQHDTFADEATCKNFLADAPADHLVHGALFKAVIFERHGDKVKVTDAKCYRRGDLADPA